jgi:hypothetical protein
VTENNWEEKYNKEHKLRQEAEGELSIIKTTSVTNSPEMRSANQKIYDLQNSLDRFKKENNDLYNKIADLTEALESKDYFRDPDYKYLIDENRRLEQERNELLVINKRLDQETKVDRARKAGM